MRCAVLARWPMSASPRPRLPITTPGGSPVLSAPLSASCGITLSPRSSLGSASDTHVSAALVRGTVTPAVRNRLERALVAIILIGANGALLASAPVNGDFWWSDAPRHALNGAFVKDFVAAVPWHDPKGWAINYYLQYPALTILFYPPLFYFFEAAAFAVFGFSHLAALATVSLFTLVLGTASYSIVRASFPRWSALGASLLVIGGPETAYWARQVMLDVPAYAAVVAGIY